MFYSQTFYTFYYCVSELSSYCTLPLFHITHTISQKGVTLLRKFVYVFLSRVWTLISPLSCGGDLNDTTSVKALMICSGDPASVCLLRHNDRRVAAPTWRETTFPFLSFSFLSLFLWDFIFQTSDGAFRESENVGSCWRRFVYYSLGNEDQPNKSWQYLWRRMFWLRNVLVTYSICQRDSIRLKLTVSR